MTTPMNTDLTYRDSGFHYGGSCQVKASKVSHAFGSDRIVLELSGPTGWIAKATVTMDAPAARALSRALDAVASGDAKVMVVEH